MQVDELEALELLSHSLGNLVTMKNLVDLFSWIIGVRIKIICSLSS